MNQKLTILLTIRNILIDHNFSNLGNTLLFTSSKTSQNLQTQTQQIFETGWRVPGSPVLDPHLG